MHDPADDRALAQLRAPCRNHYFHGKLLTEGDFELEQSYHRGADAQLARLVLGGGVVCGLAVTPVAKDGQPGLRIGAGLALDQWGRRIVVPEDVECVPVDADAGSELTVWLRHETREAEHLAGAWVEHYGVEVRAGAPPAPTNGCSQAALELVRAGRLAEALGHLAAATCADPPTDPSVVLAGVSVRPRGRLRTHAGPRVVVPTNLLLLELIACLAARLDASSGPPAATRSAGPS